MNGNISHVHGLRYFILLTVLSKLIYIFSIITTKIQAVFFAEINKLILNYL